jgi:hypothetical protein
LAGDAGTCNSFAFRFANVLTRGLGSVAWDGIAGTELALAGGRVVDHDESGFTAVGGTTLRAPTAGR